jgi:Inner membrane protein YgaP-like, transmembrane domain
MKLEKNIGTTDRIIRFVLAAIFAVLYFTGMVSGAFGIVLLVLAVVFALTAAINFCPLYFPFKLSTVGK